MGKTRSGMLLACEYTQRSKKRNFAKQIPKIIGRKNEMKKIVIIMLGLFMALGGVSYAAPMYLDNYLHPKDVDIYQRGVDVIGANPPFQIYGYSILGGGTQARIFTDWDRGLSGAGPLHARLGDVFIHTRQGTFAVAVRNHGFTVGGNYIDEGSFNRGDVFQATNFLTSDYYYHPATGLVLRARSYQYGDSEIVVANQGSLLSYVRANVNISSGGPLGTNYIDINFVDPAGNPYNFLGNIAYLSFTQTCANDVMKVPEPAMLLLLGAGLVGVGIMARRKRSKA